MLARLAVLVVAAFVAVAPASALAVLPGSNGRIAFSTNRLDVFRPVIYTMNPDGSGLQALTQPTSGATQPRFSPDDRFIAFMRLGKVSVMNADGTGARELTSDQVTQFPAWSPDSARIAFQRQEVGSANGEVEVVGRDGTGRVNLTHNSAWDGSPSWSPDGARIAFESDRNGGATMVWVMGSDGSNPRQLGSGWRPSWSPDGRRIAFQTRTSAGKQGLGVMNADGSGRVVLSKSSLYDVGPAAWSPDGRSLLFSSIMNAPLLNARWQLWTMPADGIGARHPVALNQWSDQTPDWQRRARGAYACLRTCSGPSR